MTDRNLFRALDSLAPPDRWEEILGRAERTPTPPPSDDALPRRRRPALLAAAALLAVALFGLGIALAATAGHGRQHLQVTSAGTTTTTSAAVRPAARLRLQAPDWAESTRTHTPSTAAGASYTVTDARGRQIQSGAVGTYGEAIVIQPAGELLVEVMLRQIGGGACRFNEHVTLAEGEDLVSVMLCPTPAATVHLEGTSVWVPPPPNGFVRTPPPANGGPVVLPGLKVLSYMRSGPRSGTSVGQLTISVNTSSEARAAVRAGTLHTFLDKRSPAQVQLLDGRRDLYWARANASPYGPSGRVLSRYAFALSDGSGFVEVLSDTLPLDRLQQFVAAIRG